MGEIPDGALKGDENLESFHTVCQYPGSVLGFLKVLPT